MARDMGAGSALLWTFFLFVGVLAIWQYNANKSAEIRSDDIENATEQLESNISSVGRAQTMIKEEFGCFHHETLERIDALLKQEAIRALDFMKDQIKSGECDWSIKIGTSVRVEKQIRNAKGKIDDCVVPVGSSEACRWIDSEVIK
jgi:hypothetical protein